MDYPLEKYKYVKHERKDGSIETIAISTYAGKTVRGIAVCHPTDTYDEMTGKRLAAARCNAKIAEKRFKRACRQSVEANEIYDMAHEYVVSTNEYVMDSEERMYRAFNELNDLLSEIK